MTRAMIVLIRAYQQLISPLLPPSCIYTPSCSSYAVEALRKHGFWHGSRLTARRLLRCGPWCTGGLDPVPDEVHRNTPQNMHACGELE